MRLHISMVALLVFCCFACAEPGWEPSYDMEYRDTAVVLVCDRQATYFSTSTPLLVDVLGAVEELDVLAIFDNPILDDVEDALTSASLAEPAYNRFYRLDDAVVSWMDRESRTIVTSEIASVRSIYSPSAEQGQIPLLQNEARRALLEMLPEGTDVFEMRVRVEPTARFVRSPSFSATVQPFEFEVDVCVGCLLEYEPDADDYCARTVQGTSQGNPFSDYLREWDE